MRPRWLDSNLHASFPPMKGGHHDRKWLEAKAATRQDTRTLDLSIMWPCHHMGLKGRHVMCGWCLPHHVGLKGHTALKEPTTTSFRLTFH
jgi:hypothetical protein